MDKSVLEKQIQDATGAHSAWKSKLAAAVATGELPKPARDIACDDQCSFGKWLHGLKSGPAASHPSYKAVVEAHAAFHKMAGEVALRVEQGDKPGAEALLNGMEYTATTSTLVREMAGWRNSI